jgi:hypothetical protein
MRMANRSIVLRCGTGMVKEWAGTTPHAHSKLSSFAKYKWKHRNKKHQSKTQKLISKSRNLSIVKFCSVYFNSLGIHWTDQVLIRFQIYFCYFFKKVFKKNFSLKMYHYHQWLIKQLDKNSFLGIDWIGAYFGCLDNHNHKTALS